MPPSTISPRRRFVFLNGLEDRAPGQVAFAVYRTRDRSRAGAIRSYRILGDWVRHRQSLLESERGPEAASARRAEPAAENADADRGDDSPSPDTDPTAGPPSDTPSDAAPGDDDDRDQSAERPDADWTKGRLYDLARRFDLAGRSKLNKDELLAAVTDEWERRHQADEPDR